MRRLVCLRATLLSFAATAVERIDLHTGPNVIQPVHATFAAKPAASLVLSPGAGGVYA